MTQSREAFTFAIISFGTLLVDIALFKVGLFLGLDPFFANFISASVAAILLYVIAAKYSFKQTRSITSGTATLIWYTLSTLGWSTIIGLVANHFHLDPLVAKIATIPGSFVLNYFVMKSIVSFNLSRPKKGRGHAN